MKNKSKVERNIMCIIIVIILIFYGRYVYKCDNETVAYFIGHFGFNPILLHDELYFPDPAHFYN